MSQMEEFLKQVEAVQGKEEKVLIVTGKPGSGKSKLLREAAEAKCWDYVDTRLLITEEFLKLLPSERKEQAPAMLPEELAATMRTGLSAFERKIAGYTAPDAILTGLETRTSSPVRLLRGDNFQCTGLTGLYPCGEGAGYAGGIMTAAVDGVRCAAALMQQYAPDKA